MSALFAQRRSRAAPWSALLCAAFALALPAAAPAHDTALTGTLVEMHGHRADGTATAESFAVKTPTRTRALSEDQPDALIGQRVRVTDAQAASGQQGEARAADAQRVTSAVAPGPRTLLAILLTMPDSTVAAATPDEARSAVFTAPDSANALYHQQSAGVTSFVGRVRSDGDVTEPLRIAVPVTGCNHLAIADAADKAARAAGWVPEAYDHVLYVMPATLDCPWNGTGSMPGRQIWSSGGLVSRVVAHELGHNLGAHHANAYRCHDAAGNELMLSPTCTTQEYGDPFDVMGATKALMSSWHRAQIGQLPVDQQVSLRASQTLTLVSSDDFAASGPRLLLVPRKTPGVAVTSWLAIELRSPLAPFDTWGTVDPVATGLSVRVVPGLTDIAPTLLLDATPATAAYTDAPLQPGQTLRDDAYGISVTATAVQGATATVTVTMAPFVNDVPPPAPLQLSAAGDTDSVQVSWSAARNDATIDRYEVQRGGKLIGTTRGLVFRDWNVSDQTTVTYRVIAVDGNANRQSSQPITLALADATAPSGVPGLAASVKGATVNLTWGDAQDNRAVRSYRVTRDDAVLADVTALAFSEVAGGGPHRYIVSALDTAGNRGIGTALDVVVNAPPAAPTTPAPAIAPAAGSSTKAAASREHPAGAPDGAATRAAATRPKRPRIVLHTYKRHGQTVTMTFQARGATRMRAYRGATRIATAAGSHLALALLQPRAGKPRTVRIVADSKAGRVSASWAVRPGAKPRRAFA